MKIYTRTGDDGDTGLLGGPRVPKDSIRIAAYGEIDELNACLGLLRSGLEDVEADRLLESIQSTLFEAGAELATPPGGRPVGTAVGDRDVQRLEEAIDAMEADLEPLTRFILPGGDEAACRAHLARCVCRRAERAVVHLLRAEPSPTAVLRYLNRLSDLLFVLARRANRRAGVGDRPWLRQGETEGGPAPA